MLTLKCVSKTQHSDDLIADKFGRLKTDDLVPLSSFSPAPPVYRLVLLASMSGRPVTAFGTAS